MAGELRIKSGTKLRMALDVPIGEQPKFNMICTFVKSVDVASFLISIPMVDGKPMPIDERRKLLIRYGTDKDAMIVAGYADDVVKEGIRRCWKIRRVAELRQFFQRADLLCFRLCKEIIHDLMEFFDFSLGFSALYRCMSDPYGQLCK